MQFIAGLICGLIVGVIVSNVMFIFVMSMCTISGQAEDYAQRQLAELEKASHPKITGEE